MSSHKRLIRPKKAPKGDYPVGYAKIPEHARFKPGECGNPNGRPLGSKNRPAVIDGGRWRSIVIRVAERMLTVQTSNGSKRMSTAEAVMQSITVNAVNKHQRSQRLFAELYAEAERARREETTETFLKWAEYKRTWENAKMNPGQLPDPDDVILNFTTGEVTIAGPLFKKEVPWWRRWRVVRDQIREELQTLKSFKCGNDQELDEPRRRLMTMASEILRSIDIGLEGSRAVMGFLEGLKISEVQDDRLYKRRRKGDFLFLPIYKAIRDQMVAKKRKH